MKHPMLIHVTVIGAAGFFGAITRYLVGHYSGELLGNPKFPYGTLIVNFTACLLIGGSMTYYSNHKTEIPEWAFLAVTTGFIGTYSTFSTYLWEVHRGLSDMTTRSIMIAMAYLFLSIVLGMAGVFAGVLAAKAL